MMKRKMLKRYISFLLVFVLLCTSSFCDTLYDVLAAETMIENQPEVQKFDYDYFKDNTIVIIYTFDTVRSITRADSELCISMNVDLDILEENRKKAEEEENRKKELGLVDLQVVWNVGKPPRACIILEFKKSELEGIDTIGFHCIAKE